MRLSSRFLLGAFLATVWTGIASAETPETPALDKTAFAAVIDLELDGAFERSTLQDSDRFMARLGRPTTMDCDVEAGTSSVETCTVTAPQEPAPPASLAQR